MKFYSILFLFIVFAFSCKEENKTNSNSFSPKVIDVKGYVVPKDSLEEPKITQVGIPKIVEAGIPKMNLTNLNVHIAGAPTIFELNADSLKKTIHFADEFSKPKPVELIGKTITAGVPEIVIAKDAGVKDINPGNFSFYKILQGLKFNSIRCMLQDKTGNLWFGTTGGGVTRYDGKCFTNYTEKEGLSSNSIWAMLEDKSGNLWFGTYGGGVSHFDGKTFTNYTEKEGLTNNYVNAILEDRAGNIWIGTNARGLVCYDGKFFTTFTKEEGLNDNAICSLHEDKIGNLWIGCYGGGVTRYDGNRVDAIERGEKISLNNQQDLKRKNGKLVKTFTYFKEKEGLCNNFIWSIVEDKVGNIWFGADNGTLSKYDGNLVDAIERGEKISMSHQKNLKRRNGKLVRSFSNFTKKEGLNDNSIVSIFEDKIGNLWLATYGGGVLCYDGNRVDEMEGDAEIDETNLQGLKKENGKLIKTFTSYTDKEGLSSNIVWSIFEDKSENLWLSTISGGVSRFDGKSFINFTEKESLINSPINSILEDKNGNIWIATFGDGVMRYDGKSIINFTQKEGLCENSVTTMLEDKYGNLWFGTRGGGVSRYDGNRIEAIERRENIPVINQQDLKRRNGKWIKTFTNFTVKEGGLCSNYIDAMIEDRNGNIWFGTHGGGVMRYDGNRVEAIERGEKVPLNEQKDLKRENGKLIKTFTRYTKKEGLCHETVLNILEDKLGNIWFGTTSGDVSRYDGNRVEAIERGEKIPLSDQQDLKKENGKFIKTFTNFTEKEGLSNNGINEIFEDKSGNIWFLTSNGACRYDGKSFINFTEKQGMSSTAVQSVLEDKEGNLWFGTRKGLSKISRSKLMDLNSVRSDNNFNPVKGALFYNYGYNDGFIGVNCKRNCVLQDRKGKIWWATDMLTCYDPSASVIDTAAPIVNLTGIKLFGEEIVWANLNAVYTDSTGKEIINGKSNDTLLSNGILLKNIRFDGLTKWYNLPMHLSLPYNNNNLTFNFIGVHIQSRNHIKYQYKLEGIDPDWSSISDRTEAPYGNLPSGNYNFIIKAMNQSGVWSEPFQFAFEVRPPWWKTWWFRTLVGLLIITSGVSYVKWRERTLKARQKILERTVNERTLEVVQQKQVIEEKHKEITDSINYAERIQRALLASKKLLDEGLDNYFILFKPKDVVSGDFYWSTKITSSDVSSRASHLERSRETRDGNSNFILVTADSTGHGVPGAIMSILNIACLDKAITKGITSPDLILNETRRLIIEHLKNDGSIEGGKDGMDGSLLSFDFKNNLLHCASANNPIWIIRSKASFSFGEGRGDEAELIEIKPDRFPIGKHDKDNTPFTLHTFNLQKGDVIYTLTDGFSDQFGGASGKKFKYRQLQQLLLSIAHEPMDTQKQKLNNAFDNWKGNLEQIDDVCIIGVKL